MRKENTQKKCDKCDHRGYVKWGNFGARSCECGYALGEMAVQREVKSLSTSGLLLAGRK